MIPAAASRISRALGFTSLHRNSIYLIGATVVGGAIGLVFWLVAAARFPEADVGVAGSLISVASLVALVANVGSAQVLPRAIPRASRPVGLVNAALLIVGAVGLVASLVALAVLPTLDAAFAPLRGAPVASAFVALGIVWSVFFALTSVLTAIREGMDVLRMHFLYNLAKVGLILALATLGILVPWLLGLLVASIVGLLLWLPRAMRGYSPLARPDLPALRPWLAEGAANNVAAVLQQAGLLLLPALVVVSLDAARAAHLFIALQLVFGLYAIPDGTAQSFFAEVSQPGSHERPLLLRAAKFTGALLAAGAGLLLLGAPFVLPLLGPGYAGAYPVLVVLSASAPFFALAMYGAAILRHEGRKSTVVAVYLVPTLVLVLGAAPASALGLVAVSGLVVAAQAASALVATPAILRALSRS